jgi:hypothetical protein
VLCPEYEEFDSTNLLSEHFKWVKVPNPNWTAVWSKAHDRNYYYHALTRKTVWEVPLIHVKCLMAPGTGHCGITPGCPATPFSEHYFVVVRCFNRNPNT